MSTHRTVGPGSLTRPVVNAAISTSKKGVTKEELTFLKVSDLMKYQILFEVEEKGRRDKIRPSKPFSVELSTTETEKARLNR